jgi:hypothetical protein
VKFALLSLGLIVVSLIIGMLGYPLSEGMSWVDAFLNAAMLMGGIGPVTVLHTDAGKILLACTHCTVGSSSLYQSLFS